MCIYLAYPLCNRLSGCVTGQRLGIRIEHIHVYWNACTFSVLAVDDFVFACFEGGGGTERDCGSSSRASER